MQNEISHAITVAVRHTQNMLHLFGAAIACSPSLLRFHRSQHLGRIKAINVMMESIANGDGDLTVRNGIAKERTIVFSLTLLIV
ncbi:hypothetical protein OH492_25935 [Vibrio chagasii]|nr:hypothetical protein [Vibrio chagasii]